MCAIESPRKGATTARLASRGRLTGDGPPGRDALPGGRWPRARGDEEPGERLACAVSVAARRDQKLVGRIAVTVLPQRVGEPVQPLGAPVSASQRNARPRLALSAGALPLSTRHPTTLYTQRSTARLHAAVRHAAEQRDSVLDEGQARLLRRGGANGRPRALLSRRSGRLLLVVLELALVGVVGPILAATLRHWR